MLDTNYLKAKMVENGDTQASLAAELRVSQSYLNKKINNPDRFEFTRSEIDTIYTRYSMTPAELERCFFNHKLS